MPVIELKTTINSSKDIAFDLSRSIDLHKISTSQTNEEAIAGVTSGLIGLNESVTWKARHFGITQTLTSKITAFERPDFFVDEMVEGVFKRFKHKHHFETIDQKTLMTDIFDYDAPLGILGKLADRLFLKQYMTHLLRTRNEVIKQYAESDNWKDVLNF